MLEHWSLDPDVTYLNHGTVGAPPCRVLAAQQRLRDEMVRQPSRFLLRELSSITVGAAPLPKPRLRAAADEVAAFLGARGDDLVFVDNATTGVNAVLRSFDLNGRGRDSPARRLLRRRAEHGALRGARARRDGTDGAPALSAAGVRRRAAPHRRRDSPPPRASSSWTTSCRSARCCLPVAEIAAACRARGAAVFVDGAHAPGAIPLDIPSLGVDWYTGNLHKWAQAPHTSAILWAAPERQSALHPVVISWGLDRGFTAEFDQVGTRDPTAHLAAPEGIAFMRDLGLHDMRRYNHALALDTAALLTSRLGTRVRRGSPLGRHDGDRAAAGASRTYKGRRGASPRRAALRRPHRGAAARLARSPLGARLGPGLQRHLTTSSGSRRR
jgi:isopenicillin-N epimerase